MAARMSRETTGREKITLMTKKIRSPEETDTSIMRIGRYEPTTMTRKQIGKFIGR